MDNARIAVRDLEAQLKDALARREALQEEARITPQVLERGTSTGGSLPASQDQLTAAEAKLAVGDESGARTVLRRGRERLDARASRLDDARRVTFLTKVAPNAELSKLAERVLN